LKFQNFQLFINNYSFCWFLVLILLKKELELEK
jgi:hypothetical protein